MKLHKVLITLDLCFVTISMNHPLWANPPITDSFKLNNGIDVISLYIDGSKNVSIFTYLPMRPAWDGPRL